MSLREHIERARQAQQAHEQRHDVQLEVAWDTQTTDFDFTLPAPWIDKEDDVDFNQLRQAQLELEVGRDPRD